MLVFVLLLIKGIVNSALSEKLLMRALLTQTAFVECEDAVRVLNGAQPVRDYQGGSRGEQTIQSFANEQLGLGIHAGSGFVENQETRVVGQGAGKIDELALADGEGRAALVHIAGDAFGQGADKLPKPDFVNGALDGDAVDAGRAEADVRFDRAGEKEGILEHDAELAAQVLQIDQANVLAVEEDLSALHVVKAQQQGNQSSFPCAGVTADGDGLPGSDTERDIAQNPVFLGRLGHVAIAEPDVAEFNLAKRMVEGNGMGVGFDENRLIEQLEDALGGSHGGLEDVEFFG